MEVIMSDEIKEVKIVDINMSFASMVDFMIKWSLASIPAVMILIVLIMSFIGCLDFLNVVITHILS